VLNFISNDIHYKLEERTVSPFELQNADELFLTNVMCGIQPVTKYKKKIYTTTFAQDFLAKINESI
jgi:branched-chain amino acid aminotransferase